MWPHSILRIGEIELQPYGLILIAVVVLAIGLSCWETRVYPGFVSKFIDISFWLVIGGIIGARFFYVMFNWTEFQDSPWEVLSLWKGGMVYYGAIVGGSLAGLWAARKHHLSFLFYGDIIYPYIVLSSGLGRIGCLLRGCCYGKPTALPWGIAFHDPLAAARPLEIPLHPTQAYLIIAGVVIFIVLRLALAAKRFNGEIVFLSFILYGASRFLIDFWRADLPTYSVLAWDLTASQIVSIFVLTLGVVLLTISAQRSGQLAQTGERVNDKIR
jgi:phosphatidylglycerol:prolipoprotein diacylglycerol transferase